MAAAEEMQFDSYAKLCLDCLRSCKQDSTVTVVFCPRHRSPLAPLSLDAPPCPTTTGRSPRGN